MLKSGFSQKTCYISWTHYKLKLGRTRKFIPLLWYKGGVDRTPPHQQDEVHFMGGGAAGGLSRHQQWSTSWIMPWIRNLVKTASNWYFFGARTFKIIHKKALCIILSATFTFIVERCWKNMRFHSKMAWPPATYDVISRNHSSWPSLKLSQNELEG